VLEIDGSFGEGGGQILRTALSLSCLTQAPFRMVHVRKNRSKPGLQPQHLTAVKAPEAVCRAEVDGDTPGSQDLVFRPRQVVPGEYDFNIGTAGSTSLVLQALLPPLLFAERPSTLRLVGGTHVPMSPPFDYVRQVFPFLISSASMRRSQSKDAVSTPRGGQIGATIAPVDRERGVSSVRLLNPSTSNRVKGVSATGNLPMGIAERQRDAAMEILKAEGIEADIQAKSVSASGKDTYVFLRPLGEWAGFSSLGARGKRAEVVGAEAARELVSFERSQTYLDPHLADQALIYLSLAAGQSTFTTPMITEHLTTNLSVIRHFLPITAEIGGEKKGGVGGPLR
jgi:RNA 3'-terminal phosphate cyclase (ATP)